MENSEKNEEILVCACSSLEHQVIIRGYSDGDELYVNIHLNSSDNIFKRIWIGIRFIFGYKSRFGEWDEFVLTKEHLPKLEKVVSQLKSK